MSTKKKKSAQEAARYPLLPLKDVVIFPRMVTPLLVGRPSSLNAVEESMSSGRPLFLCAQRDPGVESPRAEDIYEVGVLVNILHTLRLPDSTIKIVVEGTVRGRVLSLLPLPSHLEVELELIEEEQGVITPEDRALTRTALDQFETFVRLGQRVAPEILSSLQGIDVPWVLADMICAHLPLRAEERQELLSATDLAERMEKIITFLMRENDMLDIENKVRDRVRDQIERGQREYYLNEQLKAIQRELGQRGEESDEIGELRKIVSKCGMPKETRVRADKELSRYEGMPPMSPEAAVIRNYLEWLIEMPWKKRTKDTLDLKEAQKVLDEDHYGLKKVKERILEFLAVRKLSKSTKGPILCLVGPPGVGKTSLGASIARAMGRQFVRVSLGGVRDEAEIRGHRRTYVGAMPGRVIQGMRRVGVKNPVFLLDEVDKMSTDFRGDPSSALLEVLDPAQNKTFSDHYLEVEFDLHEVFFLTTANYEEDIPYPLLDRMEIVRLSGYTPVEKLHIAQQFLLPRQMEEAGLTEKHMACLPEAIDKIIASYTREAGVRELERKIAEICRKVAHRVVLETGGPLPHMTVDAKCAGALLGPEIFLDVDSDVKPQIGLATGLAWTMSGGDTLSIETSIMKGKGELQLTGQLGEVMRESAHAAFTWLRAHANELRIAGEFWKVMDIHVHVPEGAIPKDGPSAGTAIVVSMLSALCKRPPNATVAMTGEITLRGRVLAVGGIKEKTLAAHRAGVRTVILPKQNEKDMVDVPQQVRDDVRFIFVSEVDEVIHEVFGITRKPPRAARKKKRASTAKKPSKTKRVKKK